MVDCCGHKVLEDFADTIKRCVRCGTCQAHCPSFVVGRREGDVARGRVAVAAAMLGGELGRGRRLEPAARDDISLCLMCGSCVSGCPNDVPVDEIVGAIRREVAAETGLSAVGRGAAVVLGNPPLLRRTIAVAAELAPLAARKIPGSSGLRLRFPLNRLPQGDRLLPAPAAESLFDRLPEMIPGEKGGRRVAFFAGCSISWLFPQLGEKMVTLLRALGCTVYLPREQGCCGVPGLSTGAGKLVEQLAVANVRAFARLEVDCIVTACATCGGGIGEYYRNLGGEAAVFAAQVVDFTEFLVDEGMCGRLQRLEQRPPRRVCWHDPCHLKRRGILEPPRRLLEAMPGVEFVEIDGAAGCCGFGGTFSVRHYRRSRQIGDRRAEAVTASGAEMVATACPGCVIQLADSLERAESPVQARHLLELFDDRLVAALAAAG